MPGCNPVCTVPSCASAPSVGFGSHSLTGFGGLGYGNIGYGVLGYGSALADSASNLGVLAGVRPTPINQIPPAEATLQPPSFNITIPGPILSASCESLRVGGYTPCTVGGTGVVGGNFGYGHLGYGHGNLNRGYLGARSFYGCHGSICN